MKGEQPRDVVLGGGDLVPAQGSAASGAGIEVGGEHVGEKPRPPHSPRTRAGVVVATGATEERKLIALGRGRRAGGGIGRRVGDDFGAERGVTRQHPEVAQQVKTGGRDRSDEPSDEVVGLEDESAGAVAPDALQPELEPAVVAAQEAVLSQWWE